MDGKKMRDPLLVTVGKMTIPAAVKWASGWALFTACGTLVCFALAVAATYALGHDHVCSSKSSFVQRCVEWTDAEAAEASTLWLGMLCCALLQASAAALALLLPCRRPWVRRALAYLALALTFVGHCMYDVRVRLVFAADQGQGYLLARISCTMNIVMVAMVDLRCFLDLLND